MRTIVSVLGLVLALALQAGAETVVQFDYSFPPTATNDWVGTVCDIQPWAPGVPDPEVATYEVRVNDGVSTTVTPYDADEDGDGQPDPTIAVTLRVDVDRVVTVDHRALYANGIPGGWSCPTVVVTLAPKPSQKGVVSNVTVINTAE